MQHMPLVSICITSYNHASYIREAVDSALNQLYPNVEVVISDDCSTDGSDKILDEIVAQYKGKTPIILNRNKTNLGLAKNYEKCFKLAHGELLLTGSGDDVSLPERASALVDVWLSSGKKVACMMSDMIKIDENGREMQGSDYWWIDENHPLGAVSAYDRRVVTEFFDIKIEDAFEDSIFCRRARILGDVRKVPQKLVKYRAVGICSRQRSVSVRKFREMASRKTLAGIVQAKLDLQEKRKILPPEKYQLLFEQFDHSEKGLRYEHNMIVGRSFLTRLRFSRDYLLFQYGRSTFFSKPFLYVVLPRILPQSIYELFKRAGLHRVLRLLIPIVGLGRAE